MERLKELINQLQEQFGRKAEPSQMLETTRLLDVELRLLASQPVPGRVMPTKIAVMMPSSTKIYTAPPAASPTSVPTNGSSQPAQAQQPAAVQQPPVSVPAQEPANNPAVIAAEANKATNPAAEASRPVSAETNRSSVNGVSSYQPAPAQQLAAVYQPAPSPEPVNPAIAVVDSSPYAPVASSVSAIAAAVTNPAREREKVQERGQWPFDPLAEKPTDRFTLSQKAREVNDVIGANKVTSLNDKLKTDIADLKSTLNDTPVRDLKKAIGLNDRYMFINQLFRGDEVMYERSLKTINAFRILPEAEYWMERELKVKLGWDENREATRQFYQLVKRRFS